MKRHIRLLENELAIVNDALDCIDKELISEKGCFVKDPRGYYYLEVRSGGEKKKKYLGKAEAKLVKSHTKNVIGMRYYDALTTDKLALENCLHSLSNISPSEIPASLPLKYAGIDVELVKDRNYLDMIAWANADYQKNPREYPAQEIYARDGSRMRSKGECIWHNLLLEDKLIFRNDMQMKLVNVDGREELIAPDFVIKCYDGSLIIIEHVGLMMTIRYSARFTEKVRLYLNNGFILGKNFFVSCADANGGTDSEAIKEMIKLIKKRVLKGAPPEVVMMFD